MNLVIMGNPQPLYSLDLHRILASIVGSKEFWPYFSGKYMNNELIGVLLSLIWSFFP